MHIFDVISRVTINKDYQFLDDCLRLNPEVISEKVGNETVLKYAIKYLDVEIVRIIHQYDTEIDDTIIDDALITRSIPIIDYILDNITLSDQLKHIILSKALDTRDVPVVQHLIDLNFPVYSFQIGNFCIDRKNYELALYCIYHWKISRAEMIKYLLNPSTSRGSYGMYGCTGCTGPIGGQEFKELELPPGYEESTFNFINPIIQPYYTFDPQYTQDLVFKFDWNPSHYLYCSPVVKSTIFTFLCCRHVMYYLPNELVYIILSFLF